MTEGQKRVCVITITAVAIAAAGYSVYVSTTPEKEQVVGTLDMGPGGGRDADTARAALPGNAEAEAASGMPAEMANPVGEGKQ